VVIQLVPCEAPQLGDYILPDRRSETAPLPPGSGALLPHLAPVSLNPFGHTALADFPFYISFLLEKCERIIDGFRTCSILME